MAINASYLATLAHFLKQEFLKKQKSWFYRDTWSTQLTTYNTSNKLLRPSQFLEIFMEILEWSSFQKYNRTHPSTPTPLQHDQDWILKNSPLLKKMLKRPKKTPAVKEFYRLAKNDTNLELKVCDTFNLKINHHQPNLVKSPVSRLILV